MPMTEADWRSVAMWDANKPPPPELIPGLDGVNQHILLAWREKEVAYRMCRAERYRHGIPQ